MIVGQVVVAHLVSRSLRAFGVVSRVPFFTLHSSWGYASVKVGDIRQGTRPNKEVKQQQIKNNVELIRKWSWKW